MSAKLYEKFIRLQWLFHIQQMDSYRRGDHLADAARGQGRILAALQMKDGISTKDLSFLLGLAISSLNEFLAKLEKGGYITREQSEQDKRIILVKLTKKGRSHQRPLEEASDICKIFECLSDDEQVTLEAFLDKVIDAFGQKLGIGEDELTWLKVANAERDRLFAEMERAGGQAIVPHAFSRSFNKYQHRRGFPHGSCGFPSILQNHDNGRSEDEQ